MTEDERNAGERYSPWTWSAAHFLAQTVVLAVAGVGLLALSWGSPVLEALLSALAHVTDPGAPLLPVRVVVPLVAPFVVGIPFVFTRYRAPLLVWIAIMCFVAVLGVIEVARLNWAAFVSGIAFRVEGGPVPLVRSVGGLVVVLSGVLLLGHQSVQSHVGLLQARGVPRGELAIVRRRLLRRERAVTGAALGAGVVLLLVASVSMRLTERAPEADASLLPAIIWVGLLLAVLAAALAYLARRRRAA